MERGEFIGAIAPGAKNQMKLTGILASLTMAQAILESGWGMSQLASQYFNLFGIKGVGPAGSISLPTQEWDGTKMITVNQNFRVYHSWEESIADHNSLFTRLSRYHNLIGETDYRRACVLVQKDGYATDPAYANKLIGIIEQYGLSAFDQEAIVEKGLPDWAIQPREELTQLGITDGDRPNDPATRLEVWAFLHRILQRVELMRVNIETVMPDLIDQAVANRPKPVISEEVPDWAVPHMKDLTERGIIDGSRPNHFSTRAEVAVMLARGLDRWESEVLQIVEQQDKYIAFLTQRVTEIENELEKKGIIGRMVDLCMKPFKRGSSNA